MAGAEKHYSAEQRSADATGVTATVNSTSDWREERADITEPSIDEQLLAKPLHRIIVDRDLL